VFRNTPARVPKNSNHDVVHAGTVAATSGESKMKLEFLVATVEAGLWSIRCHTRADYDRLLNVLHAAKPPPLAKGGSSSRGSKLLR